MAATSCASVFFFDAALPRISSQVQQMDAHRVHRYVSCPAGVFATNNGSHEEGQGRNDVHPPPAVRRAGAKPRKVTIVARCGQGEMFPQAMRPE